MSSVILLYRDAYLHVFICDIDRSGKDPVFNSLFFMYMSLF
jgi:hypothetical protein